MDFSYWASSTRTWPEVLGGCQWAEANGWHGVWVPDHFMSSPNPSDPVGSEMAPVLEAWTLQAAIAALVPRVRIGAMVTGNTYRHPAVVANMAATVDHISGGRLVLGLGAGWQQNEHERYGIELGSPALLSDRLEEACEVIRGLLDGDRTNFAGDHYQLDGAPCEPKPLQDRLPLLVAGRGERRTLRTVARWADEWNAWALPEEIAPMRSVLEKWCDESGRDASEIRVTVAAMVKICDDPEKAISVRNRYAHRGGLVGTIDELVETVGAYRDAGVDELVIPDFNVGPEQRDDVLGRLQSEVFSPVLG